MQTLLFSRESINAKCFPNETEIYNNFYSLPCAYQCEQLIALIFIFPPTYVAHIAVDWLKAISPIFAKWQMPRRNRYTLN